MFCQLFRYKFLKFFIVSFSLWKCNWLIEKKSDEMESLKFDMKEQSEKISKQFETISELESEI